MEGAITLLVIRQSRESFGGVRDQVEATWNQDVLSMLKRGEDVAGLS